MSLKSVQIPCKRMTIDLESRVIRPIFISILSGESVKISAQFLQGGRPFFGMKSPMLYWQPKGGGENNGYWKKEASIDPSTGEVYAIFNAGKDADSRYTEFEFYLAFKFESGEGEEGISYCANGLITIRHSPGMKPNELPLPVVTLDFSKVTVLNAPYYTKTETYNREEVDRKIEESGGGTEKDPVFTEWRNGESVSIGLSSSVKGISSISIGSYTNADGVYSIAIGSGSSAKGKDSIAIGSANSLGEKSISLGDFSEASRENQIAIGSAVTCPETADVAIRCGGLDRFTLFNGETYPTLQSLMDARYIKPSDIPSSRYAVVTLEGASVTLSDRAINSLALNGESCTVAFPAIPEGCVVDCLLFLPAFEGSLTFPSEARLDDSVGDLAGADGTQDYLLSVTSLPDGSYYVVCKVLPKGGV